MQKEEKGSFQHPTPNKHPNAHIKVTNTTHTQRAGHRMPSLENWGSGLKILHGAMYMYINASLTQVCMHMSSWYLSDTDPCPTPAMVQLGPTHFWAPQTGRPEPSYYRLRASMIRYIHGHTCIYMWWVCIVYVMDYACSF